MATSFFTLVLWALSSYSQQIPNRGFPISPDPRLTPGSMCTSPSRKRYPEKVPTCDRDVSGQTKDQIIVTYDATLGTRIQKMGRSSFKIDHHIPLCMGGSNNTDNLWPQHISVFEITDPVEFIACKKLSEGRIKQAAAIEYVRRAKAVLSEAPAIAMAIHQL